MNSVAPASCARFANEYYETDEELLYACADAMREEYKAIIDAGLILQLDDPAIAESWDQANVGAERRGLQALHDDPHRRAQPRDPRAARRAHPLPPLLGQLARPALHRPPDGRPRGPDARGQRRRVLLRGRQRPPRARVAAVAGRQAARAARCSCPASSATRPT